VVDSVVVEVEGMIITAEVDGMEEEEEAGIIMISIQRWAIRRKWI
jgi:hypothetical protein